MLLSLTDNANVCFKMERERGVVKIEFHSPHCISEAVVHVSLDTGDQPSCCSQRQGNMSPRPPLLGSAIAQRSSQMCVSSWVGGKAPRCWHGSEAMRNGSRWDTSLDVRVRWRRRSVRAEEARWWQRSMLGEGLSKWFYNAFTGAAIGAARCVSFVGNVVLRHFHL
jgi:hypothetical protein